MIRDPKGYVQLMRHLYVVVRDVRAHVWDYVVAVAAVCTAIVTLATRIDVQDGDVHRFDPDTWWSWVVTIAICAALVGRRRWPLRTLMVCATLAIPLELGRHRDNIAFFALLVALYSVAAHLPRPLALRGVAVLAALYAALFVGGKTILTTTPLTGPVFFATAFALGRMLRRNRTRQESDSEAAVERAVVAVEIADLRAAEERLRVAQELHDVVAHSLSVIAVQAGIGVHLIERQPAEASKALDAIRTTSRTAAGELTRLVDTLRDRSANSAVAPALTDVTALVEQTRAAGVAITCTIDDKLEAVPAGVSLAAYRIVQEALTNVVRHAGRANASVSVQVSDEHVELYIDDNGRGTTTPFEPGRRGGGHGLIGMGERAQMYGGDVRAGPRPGGGFSVHATLPYFATPVAVEASPVATVIVRTARSSANRLPTWAWDITLACVLGVAAMLQLSAADPTSVAPHYHPTHVSTWLLRIGCCLALVVRRRYPAVTFAVVAVLSSTLHLSGHEVGLIGFALAISLYTVATYATERCLAVAIIAVYAEVAFVASSEPHELTVPAAAWICILLTAVALTGRAIGCDHARRSVDLAEREDAADAQTRRAQLVITTERVRIADELSMIITQSILTIAHEADTSAQMVESEPAGARRTLESISATSRDALNDVRRLLVRIRTESEPAMYIPTTPTVVTAAAGTVQ